MPAPEVSDLQPTISDEQACSDLRQALIPWVGTSPTTLSYLGLLCIL